MTNTKLEYMDWCGDKIPTVHLNGQSYVAVKPVVEALGLSWLAHARKLTADPRITPIALSVGKAGKKTVCISLADCRYWLSTINALKISDRHQREKIFMYQDQCCSGVQFFRAERYH